MHRLIAPLWASFIMLVFLFGTCSAQQLTDKATGKSFPAQVSFQYNGKQFKLDDTGVATRKKLFIKVYSIASYIENPNSLAKGDVFANILNSKNAKQLTSIWVRNVDQKRVHEGYRESLEKALGAEASKQLKTEVDRFLGFFGDVRENDSHTLRWMPDGTVTVEINGHEKGKIEKNERFARGLWSIWFGAESVVNRNDLVLQLK